MDYQACLRIMLKFRTMLSLHAMPESWCLRTPPGCLTALKKALAGEAHAIMPLNHHSLKMKPHGLCNNLKRFHGWSTNSVWSSECYIYRGKFTNSAREVPGTTPGHLNMFQLHNDPRHCQCTDTILSPNSHIVLTSLYCLPYCCCTWLSEPSYYSPYSSQTTQSAFNIIAWKLSWLPLKLITLRILKIEPNPA